MEEYIREMAEYARANGLTVHYETNNEAHHGQAALNVLSGLPPDASPEEVRETYNGWLQDWFDALG